MKYQKGMSTGAVVLTLLLVVFGSLLAIVITSYYSASNFGVSMETQLKAMRANNQNILAQGQQKVLEAAQVPEMYRDDVSKVVKAAIEGRYGAGGSKAVFQFIQEQNPSLDVSVYSKLQQLIESYRDEFKNAQTRMLDVKRTYENGLGRDLFMQQGMWLKYAGFPKINMDEYKPIITDAVETTFKNGKEAGPMKLR